MTRQAVYAIDVTHAFPRPTGIGRYALEVARRVVPLLGDDERLVLCAGVARHRPWEPLATAVGDVFDLTRVELRTQRLPLRVSYLERAARGTTLFHGTNFRLPRRAPGTRRVVTVHDLAFLAVPETVSAAKRAERERAVREAAAIADAVVVPSRSTAEDVLAHLGVSSERVHVVPHGVADVFRSLREPEAARTRVAAQWQLERPFVLAVGSCEPRKNLPRLVQAFAEAARRERLPHHLVLAGESGDDDDAIEEAIRAAAAADTVHLLGRVDDAHLADLYSAADLLVYPSLAEGFGLPQLEAMACGCPVVASSVPGVEETAGGAARLVDPLDVEAIATAITEVLTQESVRRELIAAGHARAAAFSWDRSAAAHLALWRDLV